MLARDQILADVLLAVERLNELREPDDQIAVSESAQLYGTGGSLDSLGLVSLLLDLEESLGTKLGIPLSFSDDRAMSQSRNPFRSVQALVDYIHMVLLERTLECQSPLP